MYITQDSIDLIESILSDNVTEIKLQLIIKTNIDDYQNNPISLMLEIIKNKIGFRISIQGYDSYPINEKNKVKIKDFEDLLSSDSVGEYCIDIYKEPTSDWILKAINRYIEEAINTIIQINFLIIQDNKEDCSNEIQKLT